VTQADETVLTVPARSIPLPSHLSTEARTQLAQGTLSNPPWPGQEDIQCWRELIVGMNVSVRPSPSV